MEKRKKLTIDEWRISKGLSMEELAVACRVTVKTVYNWIEKPSSVKIAQAFRLASALDVSILDINFLI